MPKCVRCDKFFHPDMCVVVDDVTNACKCVFCYVDKQEIMVENEDGSPDYKVTKGEAIENYKRYVQDLKDSPDIQNALAKKQQNPFKM